MSKKYLFLLLAGALFLLLSCTAGPNTLSGIAKPGSDIAGFWMGLWHGIIAPVTFVISLFSENINIYEVHNNGGWYDFGFVLGAGILFGGSGSASKR